MKKETIINIPEIEKLFREYCAENKAEFSDERFIEFLKFLEVDFYDWVKGNIKQFHQKQK
jgi:succinate dehydrogenase flavin-adding protein (antitoxin of CptAB toxin-antitoxin module)